MYTLTYTLRDGRKIKQDTRADGSIKWTSVWYPRPDGGYSSAPSEGQKELSERQAKRIASSRLADADSRIDWERGY